MKQINLIGATPMWKTVLQWLPYIAIPVAIFFGMTAWSQHGQIARQGKQIEALQNQRYADHLQYMEKVLQLETKLVGKIQQGKQADKVIKVDMGKTIKEFNSDIKDTKKIDNAADSASALGDVWSK